MTQKTAPPPPTQQTAADADSQNTDANSFDAALAHIRKNSLNADRTVNTAKRGLDFERLMVRFLKNDPLYGSEFTEVKRWHDWYGETDTGIDIVAKRRDGSLEAFQCKAWDDESTLALDDISTMFTTARAKGIDRMSVIFTGKSITEHAQKRCEEARVKIIMGSDLRGSNFNWRTAAKKIGTKPPELWFHQKEAIRKVTEGFQTADRGQLVMACGTGKTLTALRIAERIVGADGLVLYLMPSISLISQTMREWANNGVIPHRYAAVCSDRTAGSDEQGSITEIPITPSTSSADLEEWLTFTQSDKSAMRVIFSTYHSVAVAGDALKAHNPGASFDMVIFDEAHNTTGVQGIKESYYMLAHSNPATGKNGIPAEKRLYMTATTRVYKKTDANARLEIYSMDKKETYGEEFYRLDFSKAIDDNLLSPYKIIMREVDEGDIYGRFIKSGDVEPLDGWQKEAFSDEKDYGSIDMDYMAKVGGICKAITYPDGDEKPPRPLQRVMVFHHLIKKSKIFAGHGKNMDADKKPLKMDDATKKALSFDIIANRLIRTDPAIREYQTQTRHVDGSTNSRDRGERIDWLRRSNLKPQEIRLLSNARCLQEGVDVPALDAVAFMDPKKSTIDIIQSIGRVMRRQTGKDCGYVIVPIPVLKGDNERRAFRRNQRYAQINSILRAILAHDDELRRMLNAQALIRRKKGGKHKPVDVQEITPQLQEWLERTISGSINDKMLEEVKTVLLDLGDDDYYSKVAEQFGLYAAVMQEKLTQQYSANMEISEMVDELHENLQAVVGSTISLEQTIKTLAQHVVISRVFRWLFPNYKNPVILALDATLEKMKVDDQLADLEKYYIKIKYDIDQFKKSSEKQEFIKTFYDSFFRGADPQMVAEHGIVYTPLETVDYIIHSVEHILRTEFGVEFDCRNVKVLDPFAGTGIFLVQLLSSGLLGDNLYEKYTNDLHMNDLMLLAYYVATANIETEYQLNKNRHVPFKNSCYVDTFELDKIAKQDTLLPPEFKRMRDNIKIQRGEKIRVIVGNPPWNVSKAAKHDEIENRIAETYGKHTSVSNTKAQKNSYIKAIRWASDRIGDNGVIGFVLPASWMVGNVETGLRAVLYEEFTDIYAFDMRGNQQGTKGDVSLKEGGKIFGSGSRQPTMMLLLVKNKSKAGKCVIHYHDIGDYLSREQKLEKIREMKSVADTEWVEKVPNEDHDWLNQRDPQTKKDYFTKCMPMGKRKERKKIDQKQQKEPAIFNKFSNGIKTHRDAWTYNASYDELTKNMKITIQHCAKINLDKPDTNPKFVHWGGKLDKSSLGKALKKYSPKKIQFDKTNICLVLYRPFLKHYLYLDNGVFCTMPYDIPEFFPERNIISNNYGDIPEPNPTQPNPTQPNPTQPNPTQPNPTQPYYAATRQTTQESSSASGRRISKQLQTGRHSHCSGARNNEQHRPVGPRQDRQVHYVHVSTATGLRSSPSQPNFPIMEGGNMTIIVPDKIKTSWSVFIADIPLDLHIHEASQAFPLVTYGGRTD